MLMYYVYTSMHWNMKPIHIPRKIENTLTTKFVYVMDPLGWSPKCVEYTRIYIYICIYIYTYRFSFTQTCGMDNIQFSNARSRTFLYMKYQSTEYSQWRLVVLGVLSTSLPRPYMSANHLLNMECRKFYDIFIFITPWYKNLTGEILLYAW